MDDFDVRGVVVLVVVLVAALGAGWTQLLEHRRRMKTLDVIKAAIEQGREPPALLYQDLRKPDDRLKRWGEVGLFTAMGVGFLIAFFFSDADNRNAFGVVAAAMLFTAIVCAVMALLAPRPPREPASGDDEPR